MEIAVIVLHNLVILKDTYPMNDQIYGAKQSQYWGKTASSPYPEERVGVLVVLKLKSGVYQLGFGSVSSDELNVCAIIAPSAHKYASYLLNEDDRSI